MPELNSLNQIPCPVLVTDSAGGVLALNNELLSLIGGSADEWHQKTLDDFLPPASRIFLQTHVWPMLLMQGKVQEIQLQLCTAANQRVPILVNSKKGTFNGMACYHWVFFVTLERSRFESELLKARNLAQASSLALSKSERFIKTVTDGLPGLIAYWDKDLVCRFANKPYRNLFAHTANDVLGTSMLELLGEPMVTLNRPHIDSVLQGQTELFERQVTQPNGDRACLLANYIPDVDAKGVVVGFFVLIHDITQLKKSQVELKLAASVFTSTIEGIMIIDADGTVLSVNPAFTDITGYQPDDIRGRVPTILDATCHEPALFAAMKDDLETKGHWDGETWGQRKDGVAFRAWHSISLIRGTDGEAVRYVSVFSDITARWQQTEHTKHRALHDELTGLPNRHLLSERLAQTMARAEREDRTLALLFLDLDGFKAVNDELGHAGGDEVLKHVAKTLLGLLRKSDTVARLGGDEFVLLIDNPVNQQEVAHLADRLIKTINQTLRILDKEVRIGVSIGIAMLQRHPINAEQLMRQADSAMYVAKGAGKNRYAFHAPATDPVA